MANGTALEVIPPSGLDALPDVNFAVKPAKDIEDEAVADWEAKYLELTQIPKTLGPADPTRITIQTCCQLVSQLRILIDFSGKQNLIKYTRDEFLDNVAALYGELVVRLPPAPAHTNLRFALTAPLAFDAVIDAGTKCTGAEQLIFATTQAAVIPAQGLSVDVQAKCTTEGRIGNGFTPGQISAVSDWNHPWGVTVVNLDTTEGGSDAEGDPSLRYRTYLAPESQNTCGCDEGYQFWARTATSALIDCGVVSFPRIAGEAWLYPLMTDGRLPTEAEKDLVYEACSARKRRPTADKVSVLDPELREYDFDVDYWIYREFETSAPHIRRQVELAAAEWRLWTRSHLGRDIMPSRLTTYLMVPGVKRVRINAPGYRALEKWMLGVLNPDPNNPPRLNFEDFEGE